MSVQIFRTIMFALFIALLSSAIAGPLAVGMCYTACNAAAVSCYASLGLVFGTVTAGGSIAACGAAQGVCMSACSALFLLAPCP